MDKIIQTSASAGLVISLISYYIGLKLKEKINSPLTNPLLISIIMVITFLKVSGTSYEAYNNSAKYISYLIGPATVCLAVPLYEKMSLLKENKVVIILSIFVGCIVSAISILAFSLLFKLNVSQFVTIFPKSITTAIGFDLANEFGGVGTITAASIIVTGIFGNIFAEPLFKIFNIKNSISKGLALGTSAHAMGTVKALEIGQIETAMSSLSIVISGILTILLLPIFVNLVG